MKTIIKIGILGIAAAVTAGTVIICKSLASPKALPDGFTYTAHTGCEGTADNSMQSLEKSVELNVPIAEVDVTFRDDGTAVLFHGETAGADGGILFEDAVRFVHDSSDTMLLNLDLKAFHNIPEVVRIVEKYNMKERCFFTGVEAQNTQIVKIDGGGIPYYLNASLEKFKIYNKDYINSLISEVERSGAVGLNCNYKYASATLIEEFHLRGYKVSLWTADDKFTMKRLISLSPDNITTRYPSIISQLV